LPKGPSGKVQRLRLVHDNISGVLTNAGETP